MGKTIIFILAIGTLIAVAISCLNNPSRLFNIHVYPEMEETIKDLKMFKDRCGMHGPIIFSFKADDSDVDKIIKNNGLKAYEQIPSFVASLLVHIDGHQLSWWESSNDLKAMKTYGKEYGESEPRLTFLFVTEDGKVYFVKI